MRVRVFDGNENQAVASSSWILINGAEVNYRLIESSGLRFQVSSTTANGVEPLWFLSPQRKPLNSTERSGF